HQHGVAHRLAESAHHGRALRVEDRGGGDPWQVIHDLQVLARGVKNFQHACRDHELQEGRKVEAGGKTVDQKLGFPRRDLDQAEPRPERLLAHEFGVDGDKGCASQAGASVREVFGCGDEVHRGPVYPKGARPAKGATEQKFVSNRPSHPLQQGAARLDNKRLPCAVPRRFPFLAGNGPLPFRPCISIALTIAARFARTTSARASESQAGCTACAIMAGSSSSTSAIITASLKPSPIRNRRPSLLPRNCGRNAWCGSRARSWPARPTR